SAVIAAWSMYGQFYPYFETGWEGTLDRALRSAAIDADDLAFRDTLRRLVAALRDGHGSVPYYEPPKGDLPLGWAWVEGRLVITATGDVRLRRGDVVAAIDGVPAAQAIANRAALESGSPQWTRLRGVADLLHGPVASKVDLTIAVGSATRRVKLGYREDGPE